MGIIVSLKFVRGVEKYVGRLKGLEITGDKWSLVQDGGSLDWIQLEICDVDVEATRYATPVSIPYENLGLR